MPRATPGDFEDREEKLLLRSRRLLEQDHLDDIAQKKYELTSGAPNSKGRQARSSAPAGHTRVDWGIEAASREWYASLPSTGASSKDRGLPAKTKSYPTTKAEKEEAEAPWAMDSMDELFEQVFLDHGEERREWERLDQMFRPYPDVPVERRQMLLYWKAMREGKVNKDGSWPGQDGRGSVKIDWKRATNEVAGEVAGCARESLWRIKNKEAEREAVDKHALHRAKEGKEISRSSWNIGGLRAQPDRPKSRPKSRPTSAAAMPTAAVTPRSKQVNGAVKEVVQSGAERDKQGLKRDHQNKRCSSGEVRDSAGGVQYEFSLLRGGLHPLPAAAQ